MIQIKKRTLCFWLICMALFLSGCHFPSSTPTPLPTHSPSVVTTATVEREQRLGPGDIFYTHIRSTENGQIAVRVDVPATPRYGDSAPVVVVASTWFVEKYNRDETPFHLVYNPVDVGAIAVSHLWPGKTDPETGISSQGRYDFGGPNSLAALRDTIRFALGQIPDVEGRYLHESLAVEPLYENVGMFASSHAGVVATNVMAYHGEALQGLKYFVGRENPTMAEMYPLEIGHYDDNHERRLNPYYHPQGYTPTSLEIDYTHLDWIQNDQYPQGRPVFRVPNGEDYILDDRGPNINGKRWFSHALTQALLDNGVFSLDSWPEDVARPGQTGDFWPSRVTVHNYAAIGESLPELGVLLPFATVDHVQAARDKPHIRQAYDGFHKTAGLWTRLNCDLAYVQTEISPNASLQNGFPDNDANTEPVDWKAEAEAWGFAGRLDGQMTARTVPLAGIAEMADRVQADDWSPNLETILERRNDGNP